ncbi:MAG: ribosome recycling factor [bacterium]|nr:ribosome recycling factor [bacterium]
MGPLDEIYKNMKEKMAHTIELFKHQLGTTRTGRASTALVEGLKVDSYGTSLPIKQVASIACPDPKLIVIKPWDRNLISEIEKAILKSGIGLTPSNDGAAVKLPIPSLTEERKQGLIKLVKKFAEDSRVALRNIRRDEVIKIKAIKDLPEDDGHRGEKEIQRIMEEQIKIIDELLSKKEKEIMEG